MRLGKDPESARPSPATSKERSAEILVRHEKASHDVFRLHWPDSSPVVASLGTTLVLQAIASMIFSLVVESKFWLGGAENFAVAAAFVEGKWGCRIVIALVAAYLAAGLWQSRRLIRICGVGVVLPIWKRCLLGLWVAMPLAGLVAVPFCCRKWKTERSGAGFGSWAAVALDVDSRPSQALGVLARLERRLENLWWTDLDLYLCALLMGSLAAAEVAERASPDLQLSVILGLHALAVVILVVVLERSSLHTSSQRWQATALLVVVAVPFTLLTVAGLVVGALVDQVQSGGRQISRLPIATAFPEARDRLAELRAAVGRQERGLRRWQRFFDLKAKPIVDPSYLVLWPYRAKIVALAFEASALSYWAAGLSAAEVPTGWAWVSTLTLASILLSAPVALVVTLAGVGDLWQRLFSQRPSWFQRWPWLPTLATTAWVYFVSGCVGSFTRKTDWTATRGVLMIGVYLAVGYGAVRFVLSPLFSRREVLDVLFLASSGLCLVWLLTDEIFSKNLLEALFRGGWLSMSLLGIVAVYIRFYKIFPIQDDRHAGKGRKMLRWLLVFSKASAFLPLGALAIPLWIYLRRGWRTELARGEADPEPGRSH